MKRLIAFACLLGLVLAFASTALGDPMGLDDRWYSAKNYSGNYDYPFVGHYAYGPYLWKHDSAMVYRLLPHPANASDWQLAHNDSIVFAMENVQVPTLYKTLVLRITYGGTLAGMLTVAKRGYPPGLGKIAGEPEEGVTETTVQLASGYFEYTVKAYYFPQPSWEWLLIKNVGWGPAQGDVTITDIELVRECLPSDLPGGKVPSLTQWGMLALGVLILAAGAVVIVQRRRAMARA